MKKQYSTPQTKVYVMQPFLMADASATLDKAQKITSEDSFGSRSSSSWDDED